ncbi:MAG: sugar transferase [Syntrophobacteraceae bacterium]
MSAKSLLDFILSAIAFSVLFPLCLIVALVLRCTGEGEVFYVQERVGKGGRRFGLIKFATMLKDSPNIGPGDITVRNDPRVLPFGKILRKTKINEIPQIINILKGDMSITGPRPQTPRTFALFPEKIQKEIIHLKPGLTGIGSIVFRDEEKIAAMSGMDPVEFHRTVIAPYKGELEVWYRDRQTFWLDIKLVALTAWVIFFPNSTLYNSLFPDLPEAPPMLSTR